MIFSISPSDEKFVLPSYPSNTDIFCFFDVQQSVKIPVQFWGRAILTSLKLKRNVLILEQVAELTSTDSRWLVDANFLWLAPRSYRPFSQALAHFSSHYPSIKKYLSETK